MVKKKAEKRKKAKSPPILVESQNYNQMTQKVKHFPKIYNMITSWLKTWTQGRAHMSALVQVIIWLLACICKLQNTLKMKKILNSFRWYLVLLTKTLKKLQPVKIRHKVCWYPLMSVHGSLLLVIHASLKLYFRC